MIPHVILAHFQNRQTEIIEMIREIVEIESPSHDVGQSRLVVDWIVKEARKIPIDLRVERISAAEYGDHLLIRAFMSDRVTQDQKHTLLLGHTDTVHPVGTKLLNPTRIEEGKFFGCGIFDMKSGIVLMLEALRYFAETGRRPSRPISILLSCDEEVGSFTGRDLVEREALNADVCLVLEPSAGGRVKTGRKGTGMFMVKTMGKPSHAGLEPEKGASAILELTRQIDRLDALNDIPAGTTVNVCTIRGGTTTNVIPEHAECTVDVRFTSASEADRVENAIRNLSPVNAEVKILVSGGINRPPMERTDAVVALFDKARNMAEAFGYDVGETQVGGASDGNFVAACGVPVLDGLGIDGDGAHRMDEHILIHDIAKRAALITSMLVDQ